MENVYTKIHEKTGLLISSNGFVFIPACRRYTGHWTIGFHCGKYRAIKHNGKIHAVHRLVAETFLENPNNYPTVDHIDRNRYNNNVSNLRWASVSMQMRNTSQNDGCFKKYGTHYYENEKECRKKRDVEYSKTPNGKEVRAKAIKKWRSKFRRLKFNDGKIHYVPLSEAEKLKDIPTSKRIFKKIKKRG